MTAFLSMVDKRKALHRHISKWAMQYPEFFLSAQVPYASVVEQMCVRRMPLALVAPQDAATTAFDTLWCDLGARLAEPVVSDDLRRSPRSIRDLIAELGGEADHEAVQKPCAHPLVDVQACGRDQARGSRRRGLRVVGAQTVCGHDSTRAHLRYGRRHLAPQRIPAAIAGGAWGLRGGPGDRKVRRRRW